MSSQFFSNLSEGNVVLDVFLGFLDLDPKTVLIVREAFKIVLRQIKKLVDSVLSSLRSARQKKSNYDFKDTDRIEVCAQNVQKIIDYFTKEEGERRKFKILYPTWSDQRKENVKQLREIADDIKTSKQICSTTQIVSGTVGAIGGLALLAAVVFPPAAFVLPVWLGGAAVTALIPAAVLPAATGVSVGVAVGGGIAAGAGGVAAVATSVTEIAILKIKLDKAKKVCDKDRKLFERMMGWFRMTHELEEALKELFGVNVVLDALFGNLKRFSGMGEIDPTSKNFISMLTNFVNGIMALGSRIGVLDPQVQAAILSVLFVVFIVKQRNRFALSCVISVQRLGLCVVNGVEAGVEIGRLVTAAFVKSAELVPRAVAKRVACGVVAVVGVALDATNVVLNAIDLAEGSNSEEQKLILEVADELEKELDTLKKIYEKLI